MAVTWWMPSSFMVRLDLRWTKSSCTSNYIVRGSPAAGARRPPASCGRAVDALDRLLAAGDRVAEAVGRQPRRRAALDRRHADQFTLEALLGGGDARVAVVVEVGLVGPRIQAAQGVDEVRIGRRVGVVAGQKPRRALADAARGDRPADELDRHRVADAEVRPDVAGDERVDVAGDEHDVLDAVGLDEAERLLALGGIALAAVEPRERAVGELDRHHHHLVGRQLPCRLRAAQPRLDPLHLRLSEERAPLVELGARRRDRVVARLVGADWRWSMTMRSTVRPKRRDR